MLLAGALRSLGMGPPVVARLDNDYLENARQDRSLKGKIRDLGLRRLLPRCDRVVVISERYVDDVAQFAGDRMRPRTHLIHNPIDADRIARLSAEPAPHAWPQSQPTVLSVARMAPKKNLPLLLHAFARLSARRPNARLLMLGDGPERPRLKQLAEGLGLGERVRMPGNVANPYSYMASAGVLAVTSIREGLPLVFAEANLCGTPVVTTDFPAASDAIDDDLGEIAPRDVSAVAAALDRQLERRVPPAARDRVRRRHSAERFEASLLSLLQDVT